MENNFEGFIDQSHQGKISGWVRNTSSTDERVWVQITLSNGWQTNVCANRYRADLEKNKVGDAHYGFEVQSPVSIPHDQKVTVKAMVSDHGYMLINSGRDLISENLLAVVAGDIVNNCNLRCPFCITDYANIRRTTVMPLETYKKALDLLPYISDGMFWLSCMHEPTLHPQFEEYIKLIPIDQRRKVSFTSNFCKKLSDSLLETLANSGLNNIRISIDSFDPTVFSELRKGGRLEQFLDNLTRFSQFMSISDKAPEIHFITMVFKRNAGEIKSMIRKCQDLLHPKRQEMRYMLYEPHLGLNSWGENNLLPLDEWDKLKKDVLGTTGMENVEFFDPTEDNLQKFKEKEGIDTYESPPAVFGGHSTPEAYENIDPRNLDVELPDEALRLRMRWDGLMMLENIPENQFRQYISKVDINYFMELRQTYLKEKTVWKTKNGSPIS